MTAKNKTYHYAQKHTASPPWLGVKWSILITLVLQGLPHSTTQPSLFIPLYGHVCMLQGKTVLSKPKCWILILGISLRDTQWGDHSSVNHSGAHSDAAPQEICLLSQEAAAEDVAMCSTAGSSKPQLSLIQTVCGRKRKKHTHTAKWASISLVPSPLRQQVNRNISKYTDLVGWVTSAVALGEGGYELELVLNVIHDHTWNHMLC